MKFYFTLLSWVAISMALSSFACKAQPPFQLSGRIALDHSFKPIVYLVRSDHFNEIAADYLGVVVDSASLSSSGHFSFDHLALNGDKVLLTLVIQKKTSRFANHLTDENPAEANYMPLVLAKGQPTVIEAKATHFQKTFILTNPSSDNEAILALRDARLKAYEKYTSQPEIALDADSMILELEEALFKYTEVMRTFADQTNSIEAAMIAIRWVSPNGDFERMPEFLHSQCTKWNNLHPENPFTIELCAAADKKVLPVMIGDAMTDFAMPLVSGDTMLLHALLGHQLTIVDIWASWCAPCRKENRETLLPLWSAYKEKGLQILAYSIDSNGSSWKAAISKDKATWVHASHLSGDSTPFLEALRITTIPANFIVNAKGEIIAKNLHGEEMQNFIKEYLK